jgi:hypothetical protein
MTALPINKAAAAAEKAFGRPVEDIEQLPGGANNLVFKTRAGTRTVLAKVYFRHAGDPRDRLGAEFGMLRFLWDNGIRCIPEPIFADPARHVGIYEFIEGRRLAPGEIAWPQVEQLLELLACIWSIRNRLGADKLPPGSDAGFSIGQFIENIQGRYQRMLPVLTDHAAPAVVRDYMRREVSDTAERLDGYLRRGIEAAALNPAALLPDAHRTLNPADHGFHNALLARDGRLKFLDFEYAGWDDPVQMICNACLQPEIPIPRELKPRFIAEIQRRIQGDARLADRIRLLYPLFGFKWALIMLNEFLAVERERRQFAGVHPEDRHRAQLAKSRQRLEEVNRYLVEPAFF